MKKNIFILILAFQSFAVAADRNKVEELFLWKISDELKLSVPEEKALGDLFKSQSEKKTKLAEKTKENLKQLSEAGSDRKKIENLIAEHRKILKTYNDLNIEEVDQVQKKLGVTRTAQYLVLKNDLTNRLKTLLASPEKPGNPAAKLSPPQIIEEK